MNQEIQFFTYTNSYIHEKKTCFDNNSCKHAKILAYFTGALTESK